MTSAREVALDLLRKLIAGERQEEASLQLAMLLEKSSPFASGDIYRQILPPELADLRLSPDTIAEVISTLCQEISRNPTEALIAAISFTGADLPLKTAVKLLTNPPRPLTIGEVWGALSLVTKFLPYRLSKEPEFLPRADLERLVKMTEELRNVEETGTGTERSARIAIRMHAAQLLNSLSLYGVIES